MEYAFSFQKISEGNGLSISITGMVIVFFVLITITLFLLILPKILKIFNKIYPEDDEEILVEEKIIDKKEIVAAIGYVLLQNKGTSK